MRIDRCCNLEENNYLPCINFVCDLWERIWLLTLRGTWVFHNYTVDPYLYQIDNIYIYIFVCLISSMQA